MGEKSTHTFDQFNLTEKNIKEATQTEVFLSPRENEVLQLVAIGYSNKEIADVLQISQRTVDGHKANMMVKTKSKNIILLIKWALSKRLISF